MPTLIRIASLVLLLAAAPLAATAAEVCHGFGPQTPRDIDVRDGTNSRVFSLAPRAEQLNLCNIHFHAQAEHKAAAFSRVTDGKSGFQCNEDEALEAAQLTPLAGNHCKGLEAGDTIEVHWVHSSCDVVPGKGLGSCLSGSCANPDLRVETQVFVVVNDAEAIDFRELVYGGHQVDGLHQAKSIPTSTGDPVEFHGSTTGPSYSQETCSPLQVTWSVRPQCARVDISSLSAWCADNVFEEDHAHGVRELVTDLRLLSAID